VSEPAQVSERGEGRVRLRAGRATVEVTALAEDAFRIGFFPDGRPVEYASEATDGAAWEPVQAEVRDAAGGVELATAAATAHIALDPLRIGFSDASGRRFVRDARFWAGEPGSAMAGVAGLIGPPVRLEHAREPGERFFGCGERTSGLEKTGTRQLFWNIDPPSGHSASMVNLYTSIPFVLSLQQGRAHGVFLDNTHRVEIDLAKRDPGTVSYDAAGGDLVAYVFAGPTPRRVLERYTQLTGRAGMPPLWALGNHQSRWGYKSEEEIRALAGEFRSRGIPCDALYLDIDYMDGYRVFTWDASRFPDPAGLLGDLAEDGFRVVTIVDPGVKVDEDYPVYTGGRERDLYCRTHQGTEYRNVVWPGVCAFPDFTNPATRRWWGDNHAALLDAGVAGVWCDMDEPALFVPMLATMPDDVVHPGGGTMRLHGQVHNLYGSQMARAAHEGLARLRPERRPFVITRAGFAGLQRHALQWTGDNSSWWEHLWMAMPQLQNLGLSGVAFCGTDVGGFFGDATPELLARWTEFGILQPFCRNHAHMDSAPQEPWAFGEPWETICREMLSLRMELLPYFYGLFDEAARTGAPILRPLLFEYPADETTYTADDEFLLGDALLVAPITRPGIEHRHVYLPQGTWFHYYSGERFTGPTHILAHAPLGEPALYVRGNSPIPMGPDAAHTGERPNDPLTLLVYPDEGKGESTLYEDEGNGFGYEEGEYARRRISCESSDGRITIRLDERQGSFVPERKEVRLVLRGIPTAQGITVNDEEHAPDRVEGGALTVELGEEAAPTTVEVIL
jgi:alpha-glucosidase